MEDSPKLQQIDQEIAEGKLGIARDRLHGLINTFPEDFMLRSKLGDVYWKLGYPVQAGRWWFFDESPDELKQSAIAEFIESCNSDKVAVLKALKLKGLELPDAPFSFEALREAARTYQLPRSAGPKIWLEPTAGCLLGALLILVALANLVVDIIKWIRG